MRTRTGQRPIENPENDDEAEPEPAVHWKFGFCRFHIFDFQVSSHIPSLPSNRQKRHFEADR